MSSVSVPKKNIPKKNTSRNLVYSYYANFANLHFYWQLNSVIAITFSCIDSIDCSPFSRNPPHHPPAASLIAIESTADILWEKGVEEEPIEVGTPPPSNNHCHWTSMNTPTFSSLQHRRFRYEDYKLASSLARHWAFSYIRRSPLKCTLGSSPSLNQDINNCPLLFWRLP